MLEVRLLGQFSVRQNGVSSKINSRPAQSLLAYLIINSGMAFRREKLAGLLWPDSSEAKARNNLRQAIWRLRKFLENGNSTSQPYLLVDDISAEFNADADYILDTDLLEGGKEKSLSVEELIEIASLYQGELLPGFYDDWVILERERLQSVFEARVEQLIYKLIERKDWLQVIEWSERWISTGTVPEPAYRGLMIANSGRGEMGKAGEAYQRCEKDMQGELGLEPSEATRLLHEQLSAGNWISDEPVERDWLPNRLLMSDEAPEPGNPPYKGLMYYEEADAEFYFGREQLTEELKPELINGSPFTAIVGSSGSGKSSFVRAGLIPALKTGHSQRDGGNDNTHGEINWQVILSTPTASPLESLARSFAGTAVDGSSHKELENYLRDNQDSLVRWIRNNNEQDMENGGDNLRYLIVVDQMEELFTLCQDDTERQMYISNLLNVLEVATHPKIQIVITLRADFYAHCGQYPNLRQALTLNQVYLGPMTAGEIRRVIEEPARNNYWDFEPGLVELILRDVSKEPGALPLLSHALLETWQKRSGRMLTLQGYAASGGVRGGIARTAESVFNLELSPPQQDLAKNIFLRLTNLGDETEGTRRRVKREELYLATESDARTNEVLEILTEARLITIDEDAVEVAHEALINEWPTLHNWLVENREGLRIHRRITEAAQAWDELGRNQSELYRGTRLSQALEWTENQELTLSVLEQEFLEASVSRVEQIERERSIQKEQELAAALELAKAQQERADAEEELAENRAQVLTQLRRRAIYLTIALFFVLGMAAVALYLGDRVRRAAITAQENARIAADERHIATSRELAAAALSNIELDNDRSILLALSAVREAQSAGLPVPREAEEALHRTVVASRLRKSFPDGFSVDFSPDGTMMAYSGPASTAIVLELPAFQEKQVLSGHSGDMFGVSVSFSPDSKFLITTSADKTAKVWDIKSGEVLHTLEGHTATLTDAIFSPDGSHFATTGNDSSVRIWSSVTGEQSLQVFMPEPGGIAFDPSGRYLAVTDSSMNGGNIEIWDVVDGERSFTIPGHEQGTYEVIFSADGSQLFSAGNDGRIRIWDVNNGTELSAFSDAVPIYDIALSPDGRFIASGGEDGTAKVWDIEMGEIVVELTGHTDTVSFVDFSPDSRLLATSSFDLTTKVWDISPEGMAEQLTIDAHTNVIMSVDVSPNGEGLASASWDQSVRLWELIGGREIIALDDFPEELNQVVYNNEQTMFATADFSGSIHLWDAKTGQHLQTFQAHSPGETSVAFHPGGDRLATAGSDGRILFWEIETGDKLLSIDAHKDVISSIKFNADGSLLASGSWDGTAKVWQPETGDLLAWLSAEAGNIRRVDFHPNWNLLSTSHEDGTIRVWEIQTNEDESPGSNRLKYTLVGHINTVFDAQFNPEGTRLASTSFDGTIRLWDVESGEELLVLSENTPGPDLDFSPDGKYLVLGGGDGKVRVFILPIEDLIETAKSRVTRSLTPAECQKYLHTDTCPEQD